MTFALKQHEEQARKGALHEELCQVLVLKHCAENDGGSGVQALASDFNSILIQHRPAYQRRASYRPILV